MSTVRSGSHVCAQRTILIVEDVLAIADSIQQMVEELGMRVVGPAPGVGQAMDLIRNQRVDGALLDYELDGETSEEVAAELHRRQIPFLFLTGYPEQTLPEDFKTLRLEKPFSTTILRSRLTDLLPTVG